MPLSLLADRRHAAKRNHAYNAALEIRRTDKDRVGEISGGAEMVPRQPRAGMARF